MAGTISTSNYYGPDTPAFNSSIPDGQIRAVGTYSLTGTAGTFGFMYTGALVSGTYAVTSINVAGATNTIPHSTAGDIVVGAYDNGDTSTGNAFIYTISTGIAQPLSIGNAASLYGAWQSGSDSYVVAGGAQDPNNLAAGSQAFLANYNSSTGMLTDETFYTFDSGTGLLNHFEGVTEVDGGYELIATVTGSTGLGVPVGAALAFVAVDSGTFSNTPVWTVLDYPDSSFTTGNTVYEQTGMGVFSGTDGLQSFTATVPEPGPAGLVAAALLMVSVVMFVRKALVSQAAAEGREAELVLRETGQSA